MAAAALKQVAEVAQQLKALVDADTVPDGEAAHLLQRLRANVLLFGAVLHEAQLTWNADMGASVELTLRQLAAAMRRLRDAAYLRLICNTEPGADAADIAVFRSSGVQQELARLHTRLDRDLSDLHRWVSPEAWSAARQSRAAADTPGLPVGAARWLAVLCTLCDAPVEGLDKNILVSFAHLSVGAGALQIEAARTVRAAGTNAAGAAAIRRAGGIPALLAALRSSASAGRQVASALCTLAASCGPEDRTDIAQGMVAVLEAEAEHRPEGVSAAQTHALRGMADLAIASGGSELGPSFAAAIPVIVQVLERAAGNFAAQKAAATLLRSLADWGPANQTAIAQAGGIPALARLLGCGDIVVYTAAALALNRLASAVAPAPAPEKLIAPAARRPPVVEQHAQQASAFAAAAVEEAIALQLADEDEDEGDDDHFEFEEMGGEGGAVAASPPLPHALTRALTRMMSEGNRDVRHGAAQALQLLASSSSRDLSAAAAAALADNVASPSGV